MLKDLPSSLLKTTRKISNITQNAVLLTRPKKKWALVSKTFLEKINDKLNNHLCYIQWRSTFTVTEWFRAIEKKKTCEFIKFDVAKFYPSILAELLEKSINFARSIIKIEDKIINKIKLARKS